MDDSLARFVAEERSRYVTADNNKFAGSFWRCIRYAGFLQIITQRYPDLRNAWFQNGKRFKEYNKNTTKESLGQDTITLEGGARINPTVIKLFEENQQIEEQIQMEIETFYLFALVLLDRLSQAIWCFFGPSRSGSLKAHKQFVNNFERYAKEKNIALPLSLLKLAENLRKSVLQFRDWQISHELNPEENIYSSRMTILDDSGYLKLRIIKFYGEKNREEISSRKLDELFSEIIEYTKVVTEMMRKNNYLSTYTLLDS